jgi:hypothetical protein
MTRLRVDDSDGAPKFRGTEGDVSPFPANLSEQEGILTTFGRKKWSGRRLVVVTSAGTHGLVKDVR